MFPFWLAHVLLVPLLVKHDVIAAPLNATSPSSVTNSLQFPIPGSDLEFGVHPLGQPLDPQAMWFFLDGARDFAYDQQPSAQLPDAGWQYGPARGLILSVRPVSNRRVTWQDARYAVVGTRLWEFETEDHRQTINADLLRRPNHVRIARVSLMRASNEGLGTSPQGSNETLGTVNENTPLAILSSIS